MKDVPVGIRIIACLYIVSSVLVLAMLIFVWPALPKDHRPPLAIVAATGVFPILLIAVAVGLYKLKRWAWRASASLSTISLAIGVAQVITGAPLAVHLLRVILVGFILWYLWQPATRARFK